MTRTISQSFIDIVYSRGGNKRAKELYKLMSQIGDIKDADLVFTDQTLCIAYEEFKHDFTTVSSILWHEYGLVIKGFRTHAYTMDGKERVWLIPLFNLRKGAIA